MTLEISQNQAAKANVATASIAIWTMFRQYGKSIRYAVCSLVLVISILIPASATGETSLSGGLFNKERGVLTLAPVLKSASNAVVNISVANSSPTSQNPLYSDPFFRKYFGVPDQPQSKRSISAGSGVIVDASKGYVLTNQHVVGNADQVSVKLRDGRQFRAKLIGSDAATDIALLQINAKRLVNLPVGDSDQLRVGDFVIAIGNPFGIGQTVTSGIISALGRSGLSRDKFEDFIQTDASINPGNSGGALINTRGELIGINTAIIAPGGGNVGIGFAVPVNMVKAVMAQLIRHGEVRRGRIGIAIQDITPDIAAAMRLPVQTGAIIGKVEEGSPADRAGLKPGDAIIEMDGKPLLNSNHLRNSVGLRERGTQVKFTILRKGQRKEITVRVGKTQTSEIDGSSTIPQLAGARFSEIPPDHRAKGDVAGVLVAEVSTGKAAWRLGLRTGDIILSVNRTDITSIKQFKTAVVGANGVLALNVLRGDTGLFIVVQ